jgi:hypothetical protein
MGRSFENVRMGAKEVSARWLKARRALKRRSDLRAEAGRDDEETLQRGVLCFDDPWRLRCFGAGRDDDGAGEERCGSKAIVIMEELTRAKIWEENLSEAPIYYEYFKLFKFN